MITLQFHTCLSVCVCVCHNLLHMCNYAILIYCHGHRSLALRLPYLYRLEKDHWYVIHGEVVYTTTCIKSSRGIALPLH